MASTREVEIRFVGRLVVDDRTRAALIALGWTPPEGERWPVTPPPEGVGQYDPDDIDMTPDPLPSEPIERP